MCLFKYGPIPAYCNVNFHPFHIQIELQTEKSVDVVLGIRAHGCSMVGADGSTELWRPPERRKELEPKTF